MFFWVQNGLMTPRAPAVYTQVVPRIEGLTADHRLLPYDPEVDQRPTHVVPHMHQSPKEAYEDPTNAVPPTPILFASQVMSSPVYTLNETASLDEVRGCFLSRRFRHIPIVNTKEQIVGIITDRDLWRNLAEPTKNFTYSLKAQMIQKVLTGSLQTEIRYAAKVMLDEKVGTLPIVDAEGIVLGIITRTDLIRAMVKFPGFTLLA